MLYKIVEELLSYTDFDLINQAGGFCDSTPLGIAFSKLDLTLIDLLLSKGANIEAIDMDGKKTIDRIPENIDVTMKSKIFTIIRKYRDCKYY
ncbi:hypothetical protein [Spirochaeta cellobiosiphila]|uniref:hypothetical protein n=1 Tax=Spirochaeta cellobiosiphila TaxID=504483 RepID=UPI00040FA8D0|nr:hypothetical protein [Spirochaeta cellobiosiphila]